MSVRPADPDRAGPACAAVYAPSVLESFASFEETPPDAEEMAARIASAESTHAWLVHEHDGAVTAYAYAGPHRSRAAYRWAADVAVYVHPDHHRLRAGRALYGALLPLLRDQGLRWACAGIALPNPGSVALHEALGFRQVALYPEIGYKAGGWRDVGWWQLELGPVGAPPGGPAA